MYLICVTLYVIRSIITYIGSNGGIVGLGGIKEILAAGKKINVNDL
jgi:hypothetical protein